MSGRMYNEALGQVHFYIFFVGVNMLFFPMHFLGLQNMQRRVPDYTDALEYWNHFATIGYMVMAFSMIFFFVNIIWSLFAGKPAGDSPWGEGATTLEWTLSSPPPYHQFETLPVIDGGDGHH
jgi:cytochrome c oxidase subunit 1